MSDGSSDANRSRGLMESVDFLSEDLTDALLATGDLAFFKVHPQAVELANEQLAKTGYQLVKIKK